MPETIWITDDFITLTQLLKETGTIQTGGQAKWFLQEHMVYVDDVVESRRGRKLYSGQMIKIPSTDAIYLIQSASEQAKDEGV